MKHLISFSLAAFIVFCMLVATDRRAWGYVDPGTGLIALQTAASVVAAYAFIIRRRIRTFFAGKEAGKKEQPTAALSDAALPDATKAVESHETV